MSDEGHLMHADGLMVLDDLLEPAQRRAGDAFAGWFGNDPDEVTDSLGHMWRAVRPGYGPDTERRFWVLGEPTQVAVGFSEDSVLVVEPNGLAFGPAEDIWVGPPVRLRGKRSKSLKAVSEPVHEKALRRRRRFRWCPSCLKLTTPEGRYGRLCWDCQPDRRGMLIY